MKFLLLLFLLFPINVLAEDTAFMVPIINCLLSEDADVPVTFECSVEPLNSCQTAQISIREECSLQLLGKETQKHVDRRKFCGWDSLQCQLFTRTKKVLELNGCTFN